MKEKAKIGRAAIHLVIELFFAVLPLFVLAAVWPNHEQGHPANFWQGPEWSMTACILYGLSLARLQQGMMNSIRKTNDNHHRVAGMFVLISMLPTAGIIVSILLIAKSSSLNTSTGLMFGQYANLLLATLNFVILGGYGIDRSED